MDMNASTTTQEPQYLRLIQRALKGLSQLDATFQNIQGKLEAVLEIDAPNCSGKSNVKEPNPSKCKLEELLLDLCNRIEEQRNTADNLSNRIQL